MTYSDSFGTPFHKLLGFFIRWVSGDSMNSPFLVQYRVIEEDINDTTALGTGRTDDSDDLFVRHSDVGLNRLILT